MRLRQAPNPGQVIAVFDDGRRIEGDQGSVGAAAASRSPTTAPPRRARSLRPDGLAADPAPQSDPLLEFHNGDRIRGTICGYVAASTGPGRPSAPRCSCSLLRVGKSAEKPVAVEIDWLRRIVFDTVGGPPLSAAVDRLPRRAGDRFPRLRFSGEGTILLTDHGLVRLAYRDLAEVVMPPVEPWDAYPRQLAAIDPNCDAGIVRLEAGQGMVLTVSANGVPAACRVGRSDLRRAAGLEPHADPRRLVCRPHGMAGPATVVPLSLFAPWQVAQRGALGSGWKWQANRNVAGGELRSGSLRCLWGFGVHAPNEMIFRLPICADLPERPGY